MILDWAHYEYPSRGFWLPYNFGRGDFDYPIILVEGILTTMPFSEWGDFDWGDFDIHSLLYLLLDADP